MNRKRMICGILAGMVSAVSFLHAETVVEADGFRVPTSETAAQNWAKEKLATMSLDEKIGQLIMIAAYSNRDERPSILSAIDKYKVGGLIFFQGTPYKEAVLTNEYQAASKIPLMIGIDGEWGLAMRLDSTFAYPRNMTLGAVKDNELIFEVGKRIGEHCKRLGIQIDFCPSVDINTNPQNPIIGNRSFGSDRENVTRKGISFFKGMQSVGVLASAKHFPGHGDTSQDSHLVLPTINHSRERLDSLELYPFHMLAKNGVGSLMTGHLNVPALEKNARVPASISPAIIDTLVRQKWGYKGILVTDALNMKGIAGELPSGEIEVRALEAGNDMLLLPANPARAFEAVKAAIKSGRLTEKRIDSSVLRVLAAKYWSGLADYKPIETKNLYAELNSQADSALCLKVWEQAVTLLENKNKILPLVDLQRRPIYWVHFGPGNTASFGKYLKKYTHVNALDGSQMALADLSTIPADAQLIVSYHAKSDKFWEKAQVPAADLAKLKKLSERKYTTLVMFNSPYLLLGCNDWSKYQSVLLAYQNNLFTHIAASEIIFGAIAPKGQLPVDLSKDYPFGHSLTFEPIGRLGFDFPVSQGFDLKELSVVDSLLNDIVVQRAAPGGQLLVARRGRVILEKAFGTTMYEDPGSVPVNEDMVYDVASVTKVMATTLASMRLYEKKKLPLSGTLGDYFSDCPPDKKEITVSEMMAHNSGFQAWIPFYLQTMDKQSGSLIDSLFSDTLTKHYNERVCEGLYTLPAFRDTVICQILDSRLTPKKKYLYSDLNFILMREIVEKIQKEPLEDAVQKYFFKPLGAYKTGFKPFERFSAEDIVPSENDSYWRCRVLQGDVHDMGAALLGGVSGHAGLFSNAMDLAKINQMLLNRGSYGGTKYFNPSTVEKFTAKQRSTSRRALGFDRPEQADRVPSQQSFSHLGFTGTIFMVDPKYDLIYILLTNRTYPYMENNRFSSKSYRTVIMRQLYRAMGVEKVD